MRVPPALRIVLFLASIIALAAFTTVKALDRGTGSHRRAPAPARYAALGPAGPVPAPAVRPPAAVRPAAAARPAPAVPALTPAALRRARCFGAASEDPGRPCRNLRLAQVVYPAPPQARAAQVGEPCRSSFDRGLLRICFWGSDARHATRTVAIIGDSHASHWRAAMQDVVAAKRWRAISISRAGCPLTLAHPSFAAPGRGVSCEAWNQQVQRWVARHPSITAVFTGAHRIRVIPPPGQSAAAARLAGFTHAWLRLIANGVRHVVVFRDTPRTTGAALRCVDDAIARGLDAGTTCALPRRFALPPDPSTEAAVLLHSPRVQVADLSAFFCGPAECRPVIGGALVLRDVSHMTTTFSATLGPYLLQTVDRLTRTWSPDRAGRVRPAATGPRAATASLRSARATRSSP